MEKLEEKKKDEKTVAALTFSKVHGIGPSTSKKLAEEGYAYLVESNLTVPSLLNIMYVQITVLTSI